MTKLIFFNGFHTGDVLLSKPFVKEIIKQIPCCNFFYSHRNNELITSDLCSFIHPDSIDPPKNNEFIKKDGETVIINTWFGELDPRKNVYINHFDHQLDMYNQYLVNLNIDISYMGKNPENYIWEIEDKYINNTLTVKEGFKVLIYTNKSLSIQAHNDDQTNYIDKITDKYPEITFYVTESSVTKPNVICLNNFFTQKGLDLFQFAELSKKCTIITGNSNGAIMFSWLKSNLLNKNKIYIIQHKNNPEECLFTSKQLNKTIWVTSTIDIFNNLDKELSRI